MKIKEIADLVGGRLVGSGETDIRSVAALDRATANDLAFTESPADLPKTNAGCLIVDSEIRADCPLIIVERPKLAFARAAAAICPPFRPLPSLAPTAVVANSVKLGSDVFIADHATIGEDSTIGDRTAINAGARIGRSVQIGNDCVVHPNVVIEDGCIIGNSVILHAGVVIGGDGFGYVPDEKGFHVKFPQLGIVVIENDVEIGPNTSVDRGALGETRIGAGTKIDNLVQIAHNVQIGKHCVIAAQTGISGSTIIEDGCIIGGQVGFGDHVRVLSGAVIGSQAGILPGKIVRPGVWWGTPIQPLDEFKRQNARVKGLERMRQELNELKARLSALEDR